MKTYLKHYQNLYNVQIRFQVCDFIRFERSHLIISFNFYYFSFAQISSIELTLHIQMLRRRSLRQFLTELRHF